jgi:hypothetical protein
MLSATAANVRADAVQSKRRSGVHEVFGAGQQRCPLVAWQSIEHGAFLLSTLFAMIKVFYTYSAPSILSELLYSGQARV